MSVDPVTAYENPMGAFNRYWYANDNPFKFRDPDGRQAAGEGDCGQRFCSEIREEAVEQINGSEISQMNASIGDAILEDAITKITDTDVYIDLAKEEVTTVVETTRDTVIDIGAFAVCAAQCGVEEFIGANTDEIVGNVGTDAVISLAEERSDELGRSAARIARKGLGAYNAWQTLVCTVGCGYEENGQ